MGDIFLLCTYTCNGRKINIIEEDEDGKMQKRSLDIYMQCVMLGYA